MSSILTNFIPVFMFSHILMGFIIPCVLVIGLWCLSSSRTSNNVTLQFIPRVLFPGTHHCESDAKERLLRPGIILSSLLNHFAVMLTFGVAAPLLAFCIAWTIFAMTWMWQLALGRFVHYHMNTTASAAALHEDTAALRPSSSGSNSRIIESLDGVCADIWQGPLKAVWVVVDYSMLFFLCLSVDIVGDVRGWLFDVLYIGIPAVGAMIVLRFAFRAGLDCDYCSSKFRQVRSNPKEAIFNMSLVNLAVSPMSHHANASGAAVEDDESV